MGVVADEEDEVDEDVLKVECTNKGRRATRARDAAREEERNMVRGGRSTQGCAEKATQEEGRPHHISLSLWNVNVYLFP